MSTIVFDFDGTLADTFHIAVDVFRRLSEKAGSKRPTDDKEVEILRSLPAREAIKRTGVKWWQMPYVLYEGRKTIYKQMENVKVIAGVKPVLEKLHKQGHELYIVSTNSSKNIEFFLKHNKLEQYFDHVQGSIGLFSKAKALRKIAADSNQDPKACYYIGDEVRDIDAATHAGMSYISVAWGYNNKQALQNAGAKVIIEQPKELLALIK